MAKFKNNLVLHGITGPLGENICYKQLNGKTVAYSRPRKRPGPGTPGQEQARLKMKEATAYAKRALAQEASAKLYQQKANTNGKLNAQNLAIRDFMKIPYITDLRIQSYQGRIGNEIDVHALDDFMVTEVRVSIYNADHLLVEEGKAELLDNGFTWQYIATQENLPFQGSRIVATAFDLPGNAGSLEVLV